MEKDYRIRIVYRNERMEPVYEKTYTLPEYTEMIRLDLLRMITDIEDLVYDMNDGKPREEWSNRSYAAFCKIKHKILDKAGDIGRLPDNLFEARPRTITEFVTDILEGKEQ